MVPHKKTAGTLTAVSGCDAIRILLNLFNLLSLSRLLLFECFEVFKPFNGFLFLFCLPCVFIEPLEEKE